MYLLWVLNSVQGRERVPWSGLSLRPRVWDAYVLLLKSRQLMTRGMGAFSGAFFGRWWWVAFGTLGGGGGGCGSSAGGQGATYWRTILRAPFAERDKLNRRVIDGECT